MPTLKLTRAAIEKVKAPDPSGKQVIHWDNELRGLACWPQARPTPRHTSRSGACPTGARDGSRSARSRSSPGPKTPGEKPES